jgi:hypothetical protein
MAKVKENYAHILGTFDSVCIRWNGSILVGVHFVFFSAVKRLRSVFFSLSKFISSIIWEVVVF